MKPRAARRPSAEVRHARFPACPSPVVLRGSRRGKAFRQGGAASRYLAAAAQPADPGSRTCPRRDAVRALAQGRLPDPGGRRDLQFRAVAARSRAAGRARGSRCRSRRLDHAGDRQHRHRPFRHPADRRAAGAAPLPRPVGVDRRDALDRCAAGVAEPRDRSRAGPCRCRRAARADRADPGGAAPRCAAGRAPAGGARTHPSGRARRRRLRGVSAPRQCVVLRPYRRGLPRRRVLAAHRPRGQFSGRPDGLRRMRHRRQPGAAERDAVRRRRRRVPAVERTHIARDPRRDLESGALPSARGQHRRDRDAGRPRTAPRPAPAGTGERTPHAQLLRELGAERWLIARGGVSRWS